MPIEQIVSAVGDLSVLVGMALILEAGRRKVWVWGKDHDEDVAKLEKDRDEWKDLAMRLLTAANKAATAASKAKIHS